MIIGGPASQLLAGRVAAILNETLALCDYKTFPDGESYTQVVTPLDDEIVIIQSTPTDQDLVYLLQLLDVCQGRQVSLVIPYFGYARQDKIFKPGEPMTARAVATALNPFLKNGRVHLVNIHAPSIMSHFQCPIENLDATPLLAERIGSMGLEGYRGHLSGQGGSGHGQNRRGLLWAATATTCRRPASPERRSPWHPKRWPLRAGTWSSSTT